MKGHRSPELKDQDAPDAQQKQGSKKRREALARERATKILEQQREGCSLDAATYSASQNGPISQPQEGPRTNAAETSLQNLQGERQATLKAEDRQPCSQQEACSSAGSGKLLPAGISREQRIEVGQMCKRLIDHGRMMYLQSQGFWVWSHRLKDHL